jgi:hypothetical protein
VTRQEALLAAIEPLRQADYGLVKATMEEINFPTATVRIIKATVAGLLEYLEHEKDYPDADAAYIDPHPHKHRIEIKPKKARGIVIEHSESEFSGNSCKVAAE